MEPETREEWRVVNGCGSVIGLEDQGSREKAESLLREARKFDPDARIQHRTPWTDVEEEA